MDYNQYHLSLKERGKVFGISAGICCLICWLFYEHWFFMLFWPFFYLYLSKKEVKDKKNQRLMLLEKQFQDAILSLSSALLAGYSMENAWKEAYKEMHLLYGESSYICLEISEITRQLALNVPVENLVEDLGRRSGIEDVENFAEVFRFAKRGGGNFIQIIQRTVSHMQEKSEVRQEIQIMVASKRLEQNIMNVVPFGILAYLKLTSGDFLSVIYGNPLGILFMTGCLAVYGMAFALANRILQIKV